MSSKPNRHGERNGGHADDKRPIQPKQTEPIEGNLFVTARGVGYLRTNHIEEFDQDIEIQPENMKTALNGDLVKVGLIAKKYRDQQPQGEIIEVLERSSREFVGVVRKTDGRFILEPDDFRMYRDICIIDAGDAELEDGLKAYVRMHDWTDPKRDPEGDVIEMLGKEGEHDVEMNSIVLEHGFRIEFPAKAQDEAEKIQADNANEVAREAESRRDLRGVPTMTIDPWDAKDFDDGLSIRKITEQDDQNTDEQLWEIGIHIADVSHYVTPGSELDKEARKRAFSVYLVDRTIPMLPEELSNDVCSLNPDTDKLSFSAIFKLNENGAIKDEWFGRTVIRSQKRFTYEQAMDVINGDEEGPYQNELRTLNGIAKNLSETRFKEGAIDFETDEVEIELDENNEPKRVYKKERLDTHKLIEEFMLLANRRVARYIANKQENGRGQFLYRIHDKPNQEKIQDLEIFSSALGYELNADEDGNVSSTALNNLFQQVRDEPSEDIIKKAAIKSMSKAVYSTKNIGHYGLAFTYYTHFTSPIRRYPDLEVHRILGKYTAGEKIPKEVFDKLETIAKETSQKELEAMDAERESVKYKQVEYMANHIGETFEGVIAGMSQNGIFVAEETTGAEGMIRLRDLGDDFYTLDEKQYAIVGEKTGKKYQLGDELTFTVTDANLERKQLDYKPVSSKQ